LAGFIEGEASFSIIKIKSKTHKVGYQISMEFLLVQHSRDHELMQTIQKYLSCGHVTLKASFCVLKVTKIEDVLNKIIPFLKKYSLHGIKLFNFRD
jgi:gamma-glutamyl phosphate reductase